MTQPLDPHTIRACIKALPEEISANPYAAPSRPHGWNAAVIEARGNLNALLPDPAVELVKEWAARPCPQLYDKADRGGEECVDFARWLISTGRLKA